MTQQVLHRYAMPNSTHLSQQLVMFDEPLAKLIVKVEKVEVPVYSAGSFCASWS
jgi:hypothetical protein